MKRDRFLQAKIISRKYIWTHQMKNQKHFSGPATDINIQAQEMEKLRLELNQILAAASGQPIEKINQDTDRDFYLNAKEAIAYGLADRIVDKI